MLAEQVESQMWMRWLIHNGHARLEGEHLIMKIPCGMSFTSFLNFLWQRYESQEVRITPPGKLLSESVN